MSMPALLDATADRCMAILSLTGDNVGVQLDGQPPPFAGELYVAVHPGPVTNNDQLCLDETYRLSVTVTRRTGYTPVDRVAADALLKPTTGLYRTCEAMRAGLHMDYAGMNAANAAIGGAENGFVQPIAYEGMSLPQPKGPDWFWADGTEDGPTGVAVQIDFGFARRVQTIEEMS